MPSNILVVDDEKDLELLITQKFRKEIRAGLLSFFFANNGYQALEIIDRTTEIDLVLTDINMPEMDGLTLLGKLRTVRPELQAIVISAYGDMDNIRAAMNRGAYDFLTKPIDFDDLKITLDKTILYCEERRSMALAKTEKLAAEAEARHQEAKAQEAQRQLIEHLKKMDKVKDDFLANTSHELRTPLNGIIGIVESLMDGFTGQLRPETQQNLAMVVSSGKRLARLVDDILDFSKMKKSEINLAPEPVDIRATIDAVSLLCKPLLGQKPLQILNDIPIDLPAVFCDPNRLEQILFNLTGNAIKFTEQGNIRFEAEVHDEQVQIAISDTGLGIPESKFEDIFKSFEQVEDSAVRRQGGTGLGLAITRALIESSGGSIGLKSKVGEGSTFFFTLPISYDRPSGRPEISPSETALHHMRIADHLEPSVDELHLPPKSGAKILVVDDEPINCQVLYNHLSLQGYQVSLANDGHAALALLGAGDSFDLMILDVMMPVMSGYEVCVAVRASLSLHQLPILMLTARGQVQDVVAAFEAGANDYLTKPFDKRELLARVATLVSLHEAVVTSMEAERALFEARYREATLHTEKLTLVEKAREASRAEAQAREISQQKTNFLALMSHELRTPLNAIIGYSEILQEEMAEEELNHYVSDIRKIHGSAKNLLTMINHLLDLTKIEAGKMSVIMEHFRIYSMLEEVSLTIEPLAAQNGNKLVIDVEPGLVQIRSDSTKLRQVLLNLVGNACKFTHGGVISLKARSYNQEDRLGVLIEVQDTGIGMNEEQAARLFRPFEQADKMTARHYGGTGLGLVISQRFCQMMGGEILVETAIGKGTIFRVYLPQEWEEARV